MFPLGSLDELKDIQEGRFSQSCKLPFVSSTVDCVHLEQCQPERDILREYHKKSQDEHEKGDSGGQEGGRSDRQAIPQQRATPKEFCEKEN